MKNKLIQDLSEEIKETTKKVGGIREFIDKEDNKITILGWLEDITDIAWTFNNRNGFELEVNGKKYYNCYFKVNKYASNPKAMFISVYGIKDSDVDTEEFFIDTVTVFNSKISYDNKRITVKEEFVPTLRKLNIILSDRREKIVKEQCSDQMDYSDRYFCVCMIDNKKLKRFCKDWNYQYE